MKFLEAPTELEGKTVREARFVDNDSTLVLFFTDDTMAYCASSAVYDCETEINLLAAKHVDDWLLRDAGIISLDEYKALEAEKKMARIAEEIKTERSLLARLQQKYCDD